ncbi:MAG: prolipoprotein diacylglyceryl transferase [Eubacteriales bacterium]
MGVDAIAFPNLGIYLEHVPKSVTVFGFSIAFYGIIIGIGAFAGLLLASHIAKQTGQNPDHYWDYLIYGLIFALIGARLYYVAFSWEYYKDNIKEILNIRGGGLAIYGGVIAALLTLYVYTRIKKLSFLEMADTAIPGLVLGQMIGRYGNFMNREAFGGYSDGLFAMRLPLAAVRTSDLTPDILAHVTEGIDYIQVHPTFLYESAWNGILLILMLLYYKHKNYRGEILVMYLGGYGLGRAIVEGMRTDQLLIGTTQIAVSQLLGASLFVVAIAIEIFILCKKHFRNKVTE